MKAEELPKIDLLIGGSPCQVFSNANLVKDGLDGEIDLLWYLNDNECVLIDFKNFPGGKGAITNPNNKHYAGLYASQLKSYRDVLQASGLTVKDTLIYYSVMGCVVRLEL